MSRAQILELLARCKPELTSRYGVSRLALFGSAVRDQARPDSDIDILVSFDGPATSQRYFGVQFMLEDVLGRRVDLVTDKALRSELRPFIEQEAVRVLGTGAGVALLRGRHDRLCRDGDGIHRRFGSRSLRRQPIGLRRHLAKSGIAG